MTKNNVLRSLIVFVCFSSNFNLFAQCPLGAEGWSIYAPTIPDEQLYFSQSAFSNYNTVFDLDNSSTYCLSIIGYQGNVSIYNATNDSLVAFGSLPYNFSPPVSGAYKFQWNDQINCALSGIYIDANISLLNSNATTCNSSVSAGVITCSAPQAYEQGSHTLSSNGASQGYGLNYIWERSIDGVNYEYFTSTSGTALDTLTCYYQSVDTYYRLIVNCLNSGVSDTSELFLEMFEYTGAHCSPEYIFGCTFGDIISQISLNSFINFSGYECTTGYVGYSDYSTDTNLITTMFIGHQNELKIWAGEWQLGVSVWIDFNNNLIFDHPEERIGYTEAPANDNSLAFNGVIPFSINNNVNPGLYKMRVRSTFAGNGDFLTPCDEYTWGETEDYSIFIAQDSSYACINGSTFCDNNNNGLLDSSDVELINAPFILNYDGQTQIANANATGNFFFGFPIDSSASNAIVSIDPAWLAQNGIQYTNNILSTNNLTCNSTSTTLLFPINCDSSDIQTSCVVGLVFCDSNFNNSLDSGEIVVQNAPFVLDNGITVFTDSMGVFSYSGGQNPGNLMQGHISTSWLADNGFQLSNNNFVFSTSCSNQIPLNIGINCSPQSCSNFWSTVTLNSGYFQNQSNQIILNWANFGPNLSTGYAVSLVFPSEAIPDLNSIINNNYTLSGNTLTWEFPAGNYYSYETEFISFFIPPGIPSGTVHTYSSSISTIGAVFDCDNSNDIGGLSLIVGNSYDPNDKTVSHPPMINPDEDDELIYAIRFQNTGTAPAQDVYILDTLSSFLDWSSLKVINTSHYMQLVDLGNGVVKFNFPGIWLPDSTSNEPASHGRVVFSIKENAFNPLNSVIENTGYIYFDWNEAIITNTTYNINAYPVSGIDELSGNLVNIYPNPFNGTVNILSSKLMESIRVLDITGHEVYFEAVNAVNKSIDLSKLSQGVYLVEVNSGGEISTSRIVKK